MNAQSPDPIHRHQDGSIDTERYLGQGRVARSRHAHTWFANACHWIARRWFARVALIVGRRLQTQLPRTRTSPFGRFC